MATRDTATGTLQKVSANAALRSESLTTWRVLVGRLGRWWMLLVLLVLIGAFAIVNHDMLTKAAWLATAEYAVEYMVLAIGETFVMIMGEIDIANGAILGFSGMAGALVMRDIGPGMGAGWTSVIGILVILGVGTGIGFVNGLIRVRFNVPSFIVTLGMMLAIGYGAVDLLDGGLDIASFPQPVAWLGSATVLDGWLPIPVLITLVLSLIFGTLLQRTRFGLQLYMLGSSRLAGMRAGVHVNRRILVCFTFAGLMAGVAGLLVTANLGVATPAAGQNDGLYVITAVVIGGASLYGGRGGMLGTLVGVAIIATLTTGLVIINVAAFWQQVAIGGVLIGAVGFDQLRAKVARET